MRTLVITGCEESMWEVLDLSLPSKYRWVAKHGYDILVKRTWSAKPKLGFSGDLNHLGFLRAVVCFEQLRYYDNVMWIDGDSIITNQNYKIEDFIDSNCCFTASYNWMVPESPTGGDFTTGNFIIRNEPRQDIESLYNAFVNVSKHFLNNVCQELATFNTIYKMPAYTKMFNILPHKYLNACPDFLVDTETWKKDNNRTGIVSPWDKDCFLAHLTGCSTKERADLLKTRFTDYL